MALYSEFLERAGINISNELNTRANPVCKQILPISPFNFYWIINNFWANGQREAARRESPVAKRVMRSPQWRLSPRLLTIRCSDFCACVRDRPQDEGYRQRTVRKVARGRGDGRGRRVSTQRYPQPQPLLPTSLPATHLHDGSPRLEPEMLWRKRERRRGKPGRPPRGTPARGVSPAPSKVSVPTGRLSLQDTELCWAPTAAACERPGRRGLRRLPWSWWLCPGPSTCSANPASPPPG